MKKQYGFGAARKGAILPVPQGKTRITIRIDDDVLEWFRAEAHEAGGASYQTMMNDALRRLMQAKTESVPRRGPSRRAREARAATSARPREPTCAPERTGPSRVDR